MKHWPKMSILICLLASLTVLTGCLGKKIVIIPSDRELVACPIADGRVSIDSKYLADIYTKLKDCGFDIMKLPKIPDETGLRVSISKGHLREIKKGLDGCRPP